jgi:hypothetical protein
MEQTDDTSYSMLMGEVALKLFGEPTSKHHGGGEWRYGTRGSLSIDLRKGAYYDHEAAEGGGVLDLIVREIGGDYRDAVSWLNDNRMDVTLGTKGNGQAKEASHAGHDHDDTEAPCDWWRTKLIKATDLCDQEFPDLKYVVPGILPEGVTLLASRPKLGKSWLLLQVGAAVAIGVAALVPNERPLHGDVMYLALEDNPRRLQRRLRKYFGRDRSTWPSRLIIVTEWKRLDQGGLEAIEAWCRSVDEPTLIMIDTLKKIRAPKRNGQSDYDADYEACQGLQKLAGTLGVAIIVAHHDRKMDAEDVFDTVSGTLGLTGGVDTIAVMKRKAGTVTLHVEGRDLVESVEKAVLLDRETCRWTILGEAADIQRSTERSKVLAALATAPDGMSSTEIKGAAGLQGRGAADSLLSRMVQNGDIERLKRGVYGAKGTTARLAAQNAAKANLSAQKAKSRQMRQKDRSELEPLKNQSYDSPPPICLESVPPPAETDSGAISPETTTADLRPSGRQGMLRPFPEGHAAILSAKRPRQIETDRRQKRNKLKSLLDSERSVFLSDLSHTSAATDFEPQATLEEAPAREIEL